MLDVDAKDLLKEINYIFEKEEIHNFVDSIKNKEIPIDIFSIPMEASKDLVLGGCPREISFRELRVQPSELSIYRIESNDKYETILINSIEKFYRGLKKLYKNNPRYYLYTSLDYDLDEILDIKENSLNVFSHNIVLIKDKREKTMFIHHLVKSDKDFKAPSNMIVMDLLPGIISVFKEDGAINEIVVVLKHAHSLEEKTITFTKSDYLDTQMLLIDGEATSFDINKYDKMIKNTCKDIIKNIKNKELSNVRNINRCSSCLYKQFCETFN